MKGTIDFNALPSRLDLYSLVDVFSVETPVDRLTYSAEPQHTE